MLQMDSPAGAENDNIIDVHQREGCTIRQERVNQSMKCGRDSVESKRHHCKLIKPTWEKAFHRCGTRMEMALSLMATNCTTRDKLTSLTELKWLDLFY